MIWNDIWVQVDDGWMEKIWRQNPIILKTLFILCPVTCTLCLSNGLGELPIRERPTLPNHIWDISYRACPIAVPAWSKLHQASRYFKRAWTKIWPLNTRVCPRLIDVCLGTVRISRENEIFQAGQNLDRGWTCGNCGLVHVLGDGILYFTYLQCQEERNQ